MNSSFVTIVHTNLQLKISVAKEFYLIFWLSPTSLTFAAQGGCEELNGSTDGQTFKDKCRGGAFRHDKCFCQD
jgi:hypothetical protein